MVGENRGRRFASSRFIAAKGGCNPALPVRTLSGDRMVVYVQGDHVRLTCHRLRSAIGRLSYSLENRR